MNLHRFALAAFVAAPCFAQSTPSTETPPARFETVVVTAARSAQGGSSPAAVVVITREDIERSAAASIADVLRARAGVEVLDTFGDGSRTLVGLRGFGENAHSNTLILVDGRRLNNPDIGAPDLGSIALRDVERIEVLQGSAGALYGDQSVGGVINVVLREPKGPLASLEAEGGSYARRGARGVLRTGGDPWSGALSGAYAETDNYRGHNARRAVNGLGRFEYDDAGRRLFAEAGIVEEDLQTPGALLKDEMEADRRQAASDFQGDFSDTDTQLARLGGLLPLGAGWAFEGELAGRDSDGTFRLSFRGAPATEDSTQDRRVLELTPRIHGPLPLVEGATLTVGADLLRADYELRSPLGEQSNDQERADGYAQFRVPLPGRVELSGGVRQAHVRNDLAGTSTSGFSDPPETTIRADETASSLGLAWQPMPAWRLTARYDDSLRFAKVDEFFGSMPFAVGDGTISLRSPVQTGPSYELGSEWSNDTLRVLVLLYRLDLRDEIVFDPTTFLNANLDRTRRDGRLLEARWQLLPTLALGASYTHVEAEVRNGGTAGKDFPLVAEHVGRASIDWTIAGGWTVLAEVQANSERVFSGDFDNTLSRLPGYAVINAASRYRHGPWHVELRVNNLADREYSEFGAKAFPPPTFAPAESYFPSPELNGWLRAGLEF